MSETRHDVDIDLTVIPAQRRSVDDVLEVVRRPGPRAAAPTTEPVRDARTWLLVVAMAAVAGLAVGVPAGVALATDPAEPAPAQPAQHGDVTALLLDPLTAQAPQPGPTGQQDLIRQMLTP